MVSIRFLSLEFATLPECWFNVSLPFSAPFLGCPQVSGTWAVWSLPLGPCWAVWHLVLPMRSVSLLLVEKTFCQHCLKADPLWWGSGWACPSVHFWDWQHIPTILYNFSTLGESTLHKQNCVLPWVQKTQGSSLLCEHTCYVLASGHTAEEGHPRTLPCGEPHSHSCCHPEGPLCLFLNLLVTNWNKVTSQSLGTAEMVSEYPAESSPKSELTFF